ncbi:hypothetical protein ACFSC4_21590 [Deinococcus malanensis]|uniref:hypothetical protein n=1 Tax=Deinococcus malanensis TaxID=1706855 RepID=UPI0036446586
MTFPNVTTLLNELRHLISQTLATNELAQGGLLIATLSAAALYARTLPVALWTLAKRHLTFTLDVQGDDSAFPWLAAWLAAQPVGHRLRHLGVVTRFNEQMGGQNLTLGTDHDGDEINVRLVPLSGQVLLRFRGHWILARPERQQRKGDSDRLLGYSHSLTFRMLAGARAVIPDLLQEAYDFTAGRADGKVEIHAPQYEGWALVERRPARPLSSLIYDTDLVSGLHSDLAAFFADRDWYASMGIPYRRGTYCMVRPVTAKAVWWPHWLEHSV